MALIKVKTRLICSCLSKASLLKRVTEYFYGSLITLKDDGYIHNRNGVIPAYRWIEKKNSFRFEAFEAA